MKALRAVALAQLAFFLAWAGWEEWKVASAPLIILETAPVDPRDLLSGQYVALRYSISNLQLTTGCPKAGTRLNTPIWVHLKPAVTRVVGGMEWKVWTAAECSLSRPAVFPVKDLTQGVWVAGIFSDSGVVYGIERYYFSEDRIREMGRIRTGQMLVEAAVGRNGKLVMKRIIY